MAPTIFRNTDAGAPALNGNAGSLVNVLDWCLDTGTNAGALGWGIAFTASNKRVYRAASGVRHYLDVNDDGPDGTALGRNAQIRAYESMTAIGTGTAPFPTAAQAATCVGVVKSTATGTTARPWILIGDDKTFYFFCEAAGTSPPTLSSHAWTDGFYFGEIQSALTGDLYRTIYSWRSTTATVVTADLSALATVVVSTSTAAATTNMPRSYTGAGSGLWAVAVGNIFGGGAAQLQVNAMVFPNAVDGGLYMNAINVFERGNAAGVGAPNASGGCRGRLRGLYQTVYALTGVDDQTTFSGIGDFAGKTFMALRMTGSLGSGILAVQTTAWDASS